MFLVAGAASIHLGRKWIGSMEYAGRVSRSGMDPARIVLSSVQFGLPYGVSNNHGQVGEAEVGRILACAQHSGIGLIDTAAGYGSSEQLLGRCGVSEFDIGSKFQISE